MLPMLSLATLMVSSQDADAIIPLSANELAAHCEVYPSTEGVDAQFCIRYIQGFLDGAVATDEQVMLNVDAEYKDKDKETYTERAMRTRAQGLKGKNQERAARYAEYCLGNPVPLLEVVDKVAMELRNRQEIEDSILARAVVYGVLRKHYPCKDAERTQKG